MQRIEFEKMLGLVGLPDRLRSVQRNSCLLFGIIVLIACTHEPWRLTYLQSAQGIATKDDVLTKLGPPDLVAKKDVGGEVWKYQFRRLPSVPTPPPAAPSYSSDPAVGAYQRGFDSGWRQTAARQAQGACAQYILEFTQEGVLKTWQRTDC